MTRFGDTLGRAWTSLSSGPPGARAWRAQRIETDHPLDVFAAVREADAVPGLLFECALDSAPAWKLRFDSEGLRLKDERDTGDGKLRILLTLERRDLESVFLVIAEDLVAASRDCKGVPDALTTIGERLAAWQACLKLRRAGFTRERALGLYGELLFLEHLAAVVELSRALIAWQGPDRGLHDFQAARAAVEVKTTIGAHGTVSIASLDQLDPTGFERLALCRVVVVPDPTGTSLADVVARLRLGVDSIGPSMRRRFDDALLKSGYMESDAAEITTPYTTRELELYEVSADFPRLTREHVSPAVVSAEYRLTLASAQQFRMTPSRTSELLHAMAEAVPHVR